MERTNDIRRCSVILGVKPGASPQALKKAYYALARQWHPDRFPHDARQKQAAEAKLKEINLAYEQLLAHAEMQGAATPFREAGFGPPSTGPDGWSRESTYRAYSPHTAGDAPEEVSLTDRAWALHEEGMAHFRAGRWQEAVSSLLQAVCIKPDVGDAYYALGLAYRALKLPAKAASAFKQFVRFHPDHAEANNFLAQTYNAMGAPKDASAVCLPFLRRNPQCADAWITLGVSYRLRSQFPQALEAFAEAVRLEPEWAHARYEQGMTHLAAGEMAAARQVYEALRPTNEELAAQLLIAIVGKAP